MGGDLSTFFAIIQMSGMLPGGWVGALGIDCYIGVVLLWAALLFRKRKNMPFFFILLDLIVFYRS